MKTYRFTVYNDKEPKEDTVRLWVYVCKAESREDAVKEFMKYIKIEEE